MAYSAVPDSALALTRYCADLYVSWSSAAPVGTWFQAYLDGSLYWTGTNRHLVVPLTGDMIRIDVGSVAGLTDRLADYSGSLPSLPAQQISLAWSGGSYLSPTIAGFRIQTLDGYSANPFNSGGYGQTTLATVAAYPGGYRLDGYNVGGYSSGGYGAAALSYAWQSPRLPRGTYTIAVTPFDAAGNADGSPVTTTQTIAAPPKAPSGLAVAYSATAHTATLSWTRSLL